MVGLVLLGIIFFLGYWLGHKDADTQIESLRNQLRAAQAATSASSPHSASATPVPPLPAPVAKPQKTTAPIDNALLLLYFGAFLFLSAVGLFLAIGGLSGLAKSLTVAALVVVFYVGGQWLAATSKRLLPAGQTFMGVGMVLLPFFGLSLHMLAFAGEKGAFVWVGTSVLALLLYWHAVRTTQHSYVTYFMLAAVVSLCMSGTALVALPVYYMTWVMALVAMVFLFIRFHAHPDKRWHEPLMIGSGVLVPVSVVASFMIADLRGLWQVVASLGLSTLYYALVVHMETERVVRAQALLASATLGICTVLTGVFAQTNDMRAVGVAAILLSMVLAMAIWMTDTWLSQFDQIGQKGVGLLAALASYAALLFVAGDAALLSVVLAGAITVHVWLYMAYAEEAYFGAAWGGVLLLPFAVGLYWADIPFSPGIFVTIYGCIASIAMVLRRAVPWMAPASLKLGLYAGLGMVGMWCMSLYTPGLTAAVFAILAVVTMALSYYERRSDEQKVLFVIGLGLLYVAAWYVTRLYPADNYAILVPVHLAAIALGSYGVAHAGVLANLERKRLLRWSGIAGSLAAAGAALAYGDNYVTIAALAAAGGMVYYEGDVSESQEAREVGLGLGMAAFQWLCFYHEVREVLLYTHLWAAYLGAVAYWRAERKETGQETNYTVASLVVLTVPLALRALDSSDAIYSWLLILESIGLLLLGMMVNRPLVKRWGLWVAVAAVLYQLRELTYVALAFLALVITVIAIRVLQKNDTRH